jgi:hypothetical protein
VSQAAVTAFRRDSFLVTIFFGHLLKDPFDRGVSPHAYAMANFLIAIVVLWLHPRGDRFSVDAMVAPGGRDASTTSRGKFTVTKQATPSQDEL